MGKRIRRGIKLTGTFIQYFLIELVMIGYCSVSGIVSAPIMGKIGIVLIYAGIVMLAIFKSVLFWCVLGLVLIVATALALWMTKDNDDGRADEKGSAKKSVAKKVRNPFFEGMSIEEAKKVYKKLLKIYHPDNESGDLEKTQSVTIAYSQYCSEHGCR